MQPQLTRKKSYSWISDSSSNDAWISSIIPGSRYSQLIYSLNILSPISTGSHFLVTSELSIGGGRIAGGPWNQPDIDSLHLDSLSTSATCNDNDTVTYPYIDIIHIKYLIIKLTANLTK